MQGFKKIWSRWKAWLSAETLSEKDLMREEMADRFSSYLAECRKAWKAAGMTVAEQKEAEETEISLILEKMESEEKAEETQLLSSSEMQNYVDTVCDQIRWKQTRKAVAEELSRQLPPVYEQIARKERCIYLNGADCAKPSTADGLHLDEDGHRQMAEAVAEVIRHHERKGKYQKNTKNI